VVIKGRIDSAISYVEERQIKSNFVLSLGLYLILLLIILRYEKMTLFYFYFKGTIVYYDGQMDDSRMNVSLALSAAAHGAVVTNYVEAIDLIKVLM
jgi:glycerol-3-phosphate dehydrogenase